MIFTFGTGDGANTKQLYEALQYSGLVTEGMTFTEMCEVLIETYPALRYIFNAGLVDSSFSGSPRINYVQYPDYQSYTLTGSSIYFHSSSGVSLNGFFEKKIDLTAFSKLLLKGRAKQSNTEGYTVARLGVHKSAIGNVSVTSCSKYTNSNQITGTSEAPVEAVLDISNLTGEYLIYFELYSSGYSGKYEWLWIDQICLEA